MGYIQKKLTQVKSIIAFFEDPCQAPWTVYIESSGPALWKVILVLLDIDLNDIIRAYARPTKAIGSKKLPRLKKGRFRKFSIPDPNELVGKRVPGRKILAARKVTSGVRTLWIIDGVIQRILWWWLVAELITDFLYEWTSLVAKSEFCSAQKMTGSIAATGGPTVFGPGGPGSPRLQVIEKKRGPHNPPAAAIFAPVGTRGQFMCGLDYGPFLINFPPQGMKLWIQDLSTNREVAANTAFGKSGSLVVQAPIIGGHSYQIFGQPIGNPALTVNEISWGFTEQG